jgi:hypothetical protein
VAPEGRGADTPIVILSACDTHAIDGSHARTANGFLSAGAATVIGTWLPVDGLDSALYVARLLFRIDQLLPMFVNRPNNQARWSEIVAGFQRRVYISEMLRAIDGRGGIALSDQDHIDLDIDAGMKIDQGHRDWFASVVTGIAARARVPEERVRASIRQHAWITNALRHLQLGNPEMVVIYREPEAMQQ